MCPHNDGIGRRKVCHSLPRCCCTWVRVNIQRNHREQQSVRDCVSTKVMGWLSARCGYCITAHACRPCSSLHKAVHGQAANVERVAVQACPCPSPLALYVHTVRRLVFSFTRIAATLRGAKHDAHCMWCTAAQPVSLLCWYRKRRRSFWALRCPCALAHAFTSSILLVRHPY